MQDWGCPRPIAYILAKLAILDQYPYLTEDVEKGSAMPDTVSASKVQKSFGVYHDRALTTPVRVTKYGRETVYIVSAATFHALKQAQRDAIASADLTDAEMTLIDNAEIPAEHRYSLDK